MAYDEQLAERIRSVLHRRRGVTEKRMFGGLAFLVNGNMCCGIVGEELMLRLGNEAASAALGEPHVREMDFTGKPLESMVYVEPAGFREDADLAAWTERGLVFAGSLPPKRTGPAPTA